MNDDLNFEYGSGTHAYGGCSITLKGQFWYLGGIYSDKRQVKMNDVNFVLSIIYLEEQDYWL